MKAFTLRFTNYNHRAIKIDKDWFMIYLTINLAVLIILPLLDTW